MTLLFFALSHDLPIRITVEMSLRVFTSLFIRKTGFTERLGMKTLTIKHDLTQNQFLFQNINSKKFSFCFCKLNHFISVENTFFFNNPN